MRKKVWEQHAHCRLEVCLLIVTVRLRALQQTLETTALLSKM